jgi:hypothetical protein
VDEDEDEDEDGNWNWTGRATKPATCRAIFAMSGEVRTGWDFEKNQ